MNHPLCQLILARVREFTREPEAMFWTYGFPLAMAIALGIAFWVAYLSIYLLLARGHSTGLAVKTR